MKSPASSVLAALAAVVLAASAPPALAADVSLQSRTYVPARGTDGGDGHVLLYEYLSFSAEDLRPGLYLRAGGWGRVDLADETFGRNENGELQYAFLGWRHPLWNAEARAGRVSLTAGVARNEVFDGLMLGTDLPAGFDVTLFGGIPVELDENGRSGDSLYGARLSQGRAGLYRIGASYLKEQDDGAEAREEAGADLSFAPLPLVRLTGSSLYNLIDEAWARHAYRLAIGPIRQRARLAATWASTDYRYYFQSADNPAFTEARKDEKLERIGGEISYALGWGFTLTGEYTAYRYDVSGDARGYGGGVEWAGTRATVGGGFRQVRGDAEEDRYRQFSAHATTFLGPVRLFAGAEHLVYEAAINGEKNASTGTLGLGYSPSASLELTLSGEYGATPEYEREVKGLLAVLWRFDASTKKGGTK